jgi:hypothetical protein
VRNLSGGMDACIRATRCGNRMRARFQFGQGVLDRALDRGLISLPLPSRERGTVIFHF